jgi:hypothetical protein
MKWGKSKEEKISHQPRVRTRHNEMQKHNLLHHMKKDWRNLEENPEEYELRFTVTQTGGPMSCFQILPRRQFLVSVVLGQSVLEVVSFDNRLRDSPEPVGVI